MVLVQMILTSVKRPPPYILRTCFCGPEMVAIERFHSTSDNKQVLRVCKSEGGLFCNDKITQQVFYRRLKSFSFPSHMTYSWFFRITAILPTVRYTVRITSIIGPPLDYKPTPYFDIKGNFGIYWVGLLMKSSTIIPTPTFAPSG